jgi:hypothetical protein
MRRPAGLIAVLAAGISLAAPAALASPQRPVESTRSAGHATARPGSFGIRLVDVPVSEEADSRAWRYIVDFLHPGAVIHRRIAVQNETPKAAVVQVYEGPATISHGEFIGEAGQASDDLTTWTSVSHPVLRLRPWETVMDMVTIQVPRWASEGERYGAIWAQESSTAPEPSGLRFLEVNRVGVRIYLDIGPGGAPPTKIAITSITGGQAPGGSPEVVVGVRDNGTRAIDVSGYLALSHGPGGFSAGPIRLQPPLTLGPGQSGQMRAVLSRLTPAGSWQANVTLQSGDTTVQAHATVQLGAMKATAFIPSGREIVGGMIAILALGTGFWAMRLRRARRLPLVQPADEVPGAGAS